MSTREKLNDWLRRVDALLAEQERNAPAVNPRDDTQGAHA